MKLNNWYRVIPACLFLLATAVQAEMAAKPKVEASSSTPNASTAVQTEGTPAQAAAVSTTPTTQDSTLPEVVVTGEKPMNGEIVDSTGTRLDQPIHEVPRSVSIIDSDRIKEQSFQNINDTLNYAGGFTMNASDLDSYHFYARGYNMTPDSFKLDGFTGYLTMSSFTPPVFGLDSIAYLRGPAGLYYGSSTPVSGGGNMAPGATINMISKKPQETASTLFETTYQSYNGMGLNLGSHNSYADSIDSTGPLDKEGKVLYRFAGWVNDQASFTNGIDNNNRMALFAMTFKTGQNDSIKFTPVFQYDYLPWGYGPGYVFSPATWLSTNKGKNNIAGAGITTSDLTPISNQLDGGSRSLTHIVTGFDLNIDLAPLWKVSAGYRYIGSNGWWDQFGVDNNSITLSNPSDPQSWTAQRKESVNIQDRENNDFDVNTTYEWLHSDDIKDRTQFDFNGRIYDTTLNESTTNPITGTSSAVDQSTINLYSGIASAPLLSNAPIYQNYLEHDFYWTGLVQNQTSVANDLFVLTLSAGYTQLNYNRDYGTAGLTAPSNLAQIIAPQNSGITPNAGLVFNATKELAFYTNYSTSYQPAEGDFQDINGNTGNFLPTNGMNYEFGVKYDLKEAASILMDVYETDLNNVLFQPGPLNGNGVAYYVQSPSGSRSQGFEFSSQLRPTKQWDMNGTFTYTNAMYLGVQGSTTNTTIPIPNSAVEKTPPFGFSIYNTYAFDQGFLKGLKLNLGYIWQDTEWSAAQTPGAAYPLQLPCWGRFDTGVSYRVKSWEFGLNVINVLDGLYFVEGARPGTNLSMGAPRTFIFRADYWL